MTPEADATCRAYLQMISSARTIKLSQLARPRRPRRSADRVLSTWRPIYIPDRKTDICLDVALTSKGVILEEYDAPRWPSEISETTRAHSILYVFPQCDAETEGTRWVHVVENRRWRRRSSSCAPTTR